MRTADEGGQLHTDTVHTWDTIDCSAEGGDDESVRDHRDGVQSDDRDWNCG